MPIIAVQVHTFSTPKYMQDNLRSHLLKAGIPEYSWKAQREGFEIWHAEEREGETKIIWHAFTEDENVAQGQQRDGLEACATVLQEHYWLKLDMPSLYTSVNQPTLRVLLRLSWLG